MFNRLTLSVCCIAIGASSLPGCANMTETQKGTTVGAGAGAIVGAVIGRATAGGDKSKSTGTGAAVGAAVGAGVGYLWSKKMQEQKQAMEQATQGTGVAVTQTPDNRLKLEVPSDVSFDVGRSDIKPNFAPVLDKFAASLREHPATTVNIVGHTDNTGSDQINNPLSVNRAISTRDYLTARGVSANRIAVDGRGEREPIADNASADGRAKNRRVEIFVGEPQQVSQAQPR
jgi:outer membrane protein OmpA-like peptidoglycan-associated protein